jgi:predicted MFS family arabinose efflux permease
VVRASFSHLPGGVRETALSLDSVLVEAVFLTGPLLVGLVVLLATAGWALVAAGVLGLAGALLTHADVPEQVTRERGVLRIASVRVVLAVSAVQVIAFATVETAFTAACRDDHRAALSGVLGALWAVGSACGGLAYGLRRTWSTSAATRYLLFTVLVGALLLPLATTREPDRLLLLLPLAGLCIAPCVSSGSELLSRTVPSRLLTEAFAWTATTAGAAGASLGYALGGALVQTLGVRPAFLVAAILALAVTVSPVLERRGLP